MRRILLNAAALLLLSHCPAAAEKIAPAVLARGTVSWDGGSFAYPKGQPELAVQRILIQSDGQEVELPLHCHPAPLSAYVVKGSVKVVTAAGQSKTFKAGDAFIEVSGTWHKGIFSEDTELMVFYAGEKDVPLSVKKDERLPWSKECK